MDYKATYEKNRAKIADYVWWRHGELPDWEHLGVKAATKGNNEYYFAVGENSSVPIKIERSKLNTKSFFRDLSKPLLLKNEFNTYNIEYVVDNVRKSEDYGGDNHVYMYYDNIYVFALLLQVEDITPYLKGNKLFFIFGEDELARDYPYNFKEIYGIDYEAEPPKPLKIEEIQRLMLNWQVRPASSSNSFFEPVLYGHPNMIKISTEMCLEQFQYIYKCFLQGRTVRQFTDSFFTEANYKPYWGGTWKHKFGTFFQKHEQPIVNSPELQRFFSTLLNLFPQNYIPKVEEWLKAFAISQAAAFEINYNARIAPSITMKLGLEVNWGYIVSNIYPVLKKFKYLKAISPLRQLAMNVGSHTDHHWLQGDPLLNRVVQFVEPESTHKAFTYSGPLYISPKDEMLPFRRIVRLEDFKLHPKASVAALCDWFDIPIDDSLFKTIVHGEEVKMINKFDPEDPVTTGYETTAVYKKHDKHYAPFDYYRIELIMGKEYEYYGYKNKFYTDGKKYTNEEVMEMFHQPWKVEKSDTTEYQLQNQELVRNNLYKFAEERLSRPFDVDENGEKLVPIPWLKPKEEFLKCKLFE